MPLHRRGGGGESPRPIGKGDRVKRRRKANAPLVGVVASPFRHPAEWKGGAEEMDTTAPPGPRRLGARPGGARPPLAGGQGVGEEMGTPTKEGPVGSPPLVLPFPFPPQSAADLG